MIRFSPVAYRPFIGQGGAPMVRPAASPSAVPTPGPDPLFAGYGGLPGFVEALAVLAVTGAAGWVGIRAATGKARDPYVKAAGWVGGIGSILLGLLYLGGKSGVGQQVGIPAVRVTPT